MLQKIGINLLISHTILTRVKGNDKMKLYTSEAWLKKRINIDKKTPMEVAKECGVSLETIYVYMAKFKIKKSKRK
jgi:hypothetical protein